MKPWKITWIPYDPKTATLLPPVAWTDDSMTVADAVAVQLLVGTENGWAACNPWDGPLQLAAIITAMCVRAVAPEDATDEELADLMMAQMTLIRRLGIEKVLDALEERPVPKE